MKKLIGLIAILLLLGSVANAKMYWLQLDPNKFGSDTAGTIVIPGTNTPAGFTVQTVVYDSSAYVDSSCCTWRTQCINTENAISATGMLEVISITDTSTADDHLFDGIADSVYGYYEVKTAYTPYNDTNFNLVDAAVLTTVSGTAKYLPITISSEGDEVLDTLFKTWTWVEFTICDSTRWGEKFTQDYIIVGEGLDDATVAGTYTGSGELGVYTYWFVADDADPDSFSWTHTGNQDHEASGVDSVAITGSAQTLDSGMTVNFNATDGHTAGDSFIFVVSDSLHYLKTVDWAIRIGLNVHER